MTKKLVYILLIMVTIFSYACNKETCNDGELNQDESSIDCGGTECDPCPSCSDGIQNQGETGIDCGDVCTPCGVPQSCSDGVQNQDETGVDCGGVCTPCGTTVDCNNLADTFSYTRDGGTNINADVLSANLQSGNLVITATVLNPSSIFTITQTGANFGTGNFNVGAGGTTTTVQFTDNATATTYSTINSNSSGTINFTAFEQGGACNYVSGSFNIMLSEISPNTSGSVALVGNFNELEF